MANMGSASTGNEEGSGLMAVTVSRLKARLQELEQQNTSLGNDKDDLLNQVSALQQSCNEGMSELSKTKLIHRQQSTVLQDELQQLKNQLEEAHAITEESKHQVEAARAEVHALLSSRESSSQALRAQAAQLQTQLTAKSSEAAALARKLAAIEPLADALESELHMLQQGLTKVTIRVQQQEAGLKEHEKRLVDVTRAGEKLADQLDVKHAALQAAQQQLQESQANRAAAEEAQRTAHQQLQEQLTAAQEQLDVLTQESAAKQNELTYQLAEEQKISVELQQQLQQLQEALQTEKEAAAQCKTLSEQLDSKNTAAAKAAIEAAQQRNAGATAVVVLHNAYMTLRSKACKVIRAAKAQADIAKQEAAASAADAAAAKAAAEQSTAVAQQAAEAKADAAAVALKAAVAAAEDRAAAAAAACAASNERAVVAEAKLATAEAGCVAAEARAVAAEATTAAAAQQAAGQPGKASSSTLKPTVATADTAQQTSPSVRPSRATTAPSAPITAPATSAVVTKPNIESAPQKTQALIGFSQSQPGTCSALHSGVLLTSSQGEALQGPLAGHQHRPLSGNKRINPETADGNAIAGVRQCRAMPNSVFQHHQQPQQQQSVYSTPGSLQQQQQHARGTGVAVSALSALQLQAPGGYNHFSSVTAPGQHASVGPDANRGHATPGYAAAVVAAAGAGQKQMGSGTYQGTTAGAQQHVSWTSAAAAAAQATAPKFMPGQQALQQQQQHLQHRPYPQQLQHTKPAAAPVFVPTSLMSARKTDSTGGQDSVGASSEGRIAALKVPPQPAQLPSAVVCTAAGNESAVRCVPSTAHRGSNHAGQGTPSAVVHTIDHQNDQQQQLGRTCHAAAAPKSSPAAVPPVAAAAATEADVTSSDKANPLVGTSCKTTNPVLSAVTVNASEKNTGVAQGRISMAGIDTVMTDAMHPKDQHQQQEVVAAVCVAAVAQQPVQPQQPEVAVKAKQQQDSKKAPAAQPATAMGMLFCALADDSDDDSD